MDKAIENINKTKEFRGLRKKRKRKQRQLSQKYDKNKKPIGKGGENRYKFNKTKNMDQLEGGTKRIQYKQSHIRLNHIHPATNTIVKTKPSKIVVEELNVSGMMKNRPLSKAIAAQGFHPFVKRLSYKCEWNKMEVVKASWFYPPSKKCSCCGEIKKEWKLKVPSVWLST